MVVGQHVRLYRRSAFRRQWRQALLSAPVWRRRPTSSPRSSRQIWPAAMFAVGMHRLLYTGVITVHANEEAVHRRYRQLVKERSPRPKVASHVFRAFLLGGTLGLIGHFLFSFFQAVEPSKAEATAATLAGLIMLGAVLTGLGVYDKLAEWGGAGAAIPITGFANTIVAAAMDFRREGLVLGMAAKMFVITGPVLVFGTVAGFLAGLVKVAVLGLLK
jgi:stage V sporulation protein AC